VCVCVCVCVCAAVLLHGEGQLVVGALDLVLGLQVRHALGAQAVDGRDDVALGQAAPRRQAAGGYLQVGEGEGEEG